MPLRDLLFDITTPPPLPRPGLQNLHAAPSSRADRLWNFFADPRRIGNDNIGTLAASLNTYVAPWGLAGLFLDDVERGDYQSAAMSLIPGKAGVQKGLSKLTEAAAEKTLGAGRRRATRTPPPPAPAVLTPNAANAALPDIRRMSAAQGVAATVGDPHLIPKPGGGYVGGPRNIRSRTGLHNMRRDFDEFVAADPRGADWYDRYRASVARATGNQPRDNEWFSSHLASYSPQRSPDFELNMSLKEGNSAIMGRPVRPNTQVQHDAFLRSVDANDPKLFGLQQKTGEYGFANNPNNPIDHATGTNDKRHGNNLRYTERSGDISEGSYSPAEHKFMDYETGAAVGRANAANLGGRSDWTGPRLQAAPWVRQKAQDLVVQRNLVEKYVEQNAQDLVVQRNLVAKYVEQGHKKADASRLAYKEASEEASKNIGNAERLAYEEAFEEANKTIGDWFPKHTAFMTYEEQPGANIGPHMVRSSAADPAEKAAFFHDPRSNWALAPGGRDAIYGGLRVGETGIAARVLPTENMQGFYLNDAGGLETNLGAVARPLVAFENIGGGTKALPTADRDMLETGEALRALIGGQETGAGHKLWFGGKVGDSNSAFIPRDAMSTPEEMDAVRGVTSQYGLNDIVDTSTGLTATQFYPGAPEIKSKQFNEMVAGLEKLGLPPAERAKVDPIYEPLGELWRKGEGSGAVTDYVLGKLNINPQKRAAFNNNPYIPQAALNHMERDADWAAKWDIPREDLQNLRAIIGEGTGWIDRLEEAVKAGKIALPALVGILGASAMTDDGQSVESKPQS